MSHGSGTHSRGAQDSTNKLNLEEASHSGEATGPVSTSRVALCESEQKTQLSHDYTHGNFEIIYVQDATFVIVCYMANNSQA